MKRIVIALLLALTACDEAPTEGTTGEIDEVSTGATEDESGSSGDTFEPWTGEAMNLRVIDVYADSCDRACGSSHCAGSYDTTADEQAFCDETVGQNECTCADVTETVEASSNVAISGCYLNPNSGSRLAVDPPKWSAGSCEDYCGTFGFSCLATVWGESKDCPNLSVDTDWSLHYDAPTTRPADIPGPDGVFRVLCSM